MASIKFLVLVIATIIGWRFMGRALDRLESVRHETRIKERLRDLGRWIHSAVGAVAIVIVLILLVRLIVLAAKHH